VHLAPDDGGVLLSLAQALERADRRAEALQVATGAAAYLPAGYEDLADLLWRLQSA